MSTASTRTAPAATVWTTVEAWFSNLCFAELVVEVRHRGGSTVQGVVVRRVAACTFLGDGVGGDGWSGDHRGQSKNHGDCAGEHQSSRWDLNRCHSHTLSSSRRPQRPAGTQDSRACCQEPADRAFEVNQFTLTACEQPGRLVGVALVDQALVDHHRGCEWVGFYECGLTGPCLLVCRLCATASRCVIPVWCCIRTKRIDVYRPSPGG